MDAEQPVISVTTSGTTPRRSPSRESTSLVALLSSEMHRLGLSDAGYSRMPSPGPGSRLQVPSGRNCSSSSVWCEEEVDLIRSCGALSRWLGMPKSFSTGDIARLRDDADTLRRSVSEVVLHGVRLADLTYTRLDRASRSCSTWVAVGDLASTSQLPSPHGRPQTPGQCPFTTADLVRTVNKKVRHNYIRRRLQLTFRALQRLSRSDFQLEQLFSGPLVDGLPAVGAAGGPTKTVAHQPATAPAGDTADSATPVGPLTIPKGISVRDVDRERGKPLTRYQRNMLVFNWLQHLDGDGLEVT